MSFSRRAACITIPAIIALLGGWGAPARAYERATVDGTTNIFLYWTSRRIEYWVNQRGSEDVSLQEALGAIRRSFFTWSSPSCTDIYFTFGGTTTNTKTNLNSPLAEPDKKNTIIWRESSWPPAGAEDGSVTPEMAALTVITYNADTGEIIDADIDLNGHDFFWTTTDDKTKAATDVQNVVTHEAGHLIGLAHSTVPDATMYGSTPQGELSKRELDKDDLDALCTIYPFDARTPLGNGQPQPKGQVQGATGCAIGAGGAARASRLGVLALLALLAALGAALRRRRRRAPARCASPRGQPRR